MIQDWRGPSHKAAKKWVQRVPEKRELGFGKYRLAVTDFTALVIHASWPAEKLIFVGEDTQLRYTNLILAFHRQSTCAERTAQFKINDLVPDMPADHIEHPEWPLLRHQRVGVVNSLQQPAYALFQEQGTCKTSTVIARVCIESARKRAGILPGTKRPTMYRVLVVCPNSVRRNWGEEFEQFATVPGKFGVIKGDYEPRVRKLLDGIRDEEDCAWGACIIGWDSLQTTMDALLRAPWDLVVLDESHMGKNSRTIRWAEAIKIIRTGFVRQVMLLTGTPIANTVMDLWAQFELMGPGLSGFRTFRNFRSFHGKFVSAGQGGGSAVERLVGIKNIPLLQERLARMAFMVRKVDCLDLPPKVYDVVEVEMSKTQAEWYAKVQADLALELEDIIADETKRISADHILTKLLRLAQITSGYVKWDAELDFQTGEVVSGGREESVPGSNPKMDQLIEMFKEEWGANPHGKKIVWACFRHNIKALIQRFAVEGIEAVSYFGDTSDAQRDIAVERFNNDSTVKVFIANPQTAGAGLNLLGYNPKASDKQLTATDHEVFFSQGWSAVLRCQAEDRAHRMGTRNSVRITDLVTPGTIDEDIRDRVQSKIETALAIQDVREILKNVLHIGENHAATSVHS